MLISFVDAKNGLKFLEYLRNIGCTVDEEAHTVLPDSSEYGLYTCRQDGILKAVFVMHYIDHHYAALMDLKDNASDREVIEALLKAKEKGVWMAPIEPIIYIPVDYEIIKKLSIYGDDIPAEAAKHVEIYLNSNTAWRELLRESISSLIKFIQNIANTFEV
ncbi:MAG: hypothetical protein QXT53_06945 [Ignisphaera sp.]